jgi:broad specificity phosphatase PhoE
MVSQASRRLGLRFTQITFLVASAVLLTQTAFASPKSVRAWWDYSDMIEALQEGRHVLIVRHERTEVPSRDDDYTRAPDDCTAQRNLSVAGVAGAQETGIVLRALDIEIGRVITSPMCRSAETARYMFGVGYQTDARLMHEDPAGERNMDVAEQEMRALLTELAVELSDKNIALVGHGGVIHRTTGLGLSEGEFGVLRFEEDGRITIVGQFLGSDLAPFARRALEVAD